MLSPCSSVFSLHRLLMQVQWRGGKGCLNDKPSMTTPYFVSDCKEVFDLFDFWDGRDGLVDAAKVGDFLRSLGLNPTEEQILKNGGCKKMGTYVAI